MLDESLIHKAIIESIDSILLKEGFMGGFNALRGGIQQRNQARTNVLTLPQKHNIDKKNKQDRIIAILNAINNTIESNKPIVKSIGSSLKNKDYRGLYNQYSNFVNNFVNGGNYDDNESNSDDIDDDDYGFNTFLKDFRR